MKFLIFNGSLKPDAESNTFAVCKMAQLAFEKLGHECEIVTLRDLDYEGSTDDVNDELKPYIMKMFDMDGVLFATPIWWGTHSCTYRPCLRDWISYTVGQKTTSINLSTTKFLEHWYQVEEMASNTYTEYCTQRQVILDSLYHHSVT